jgi:prevent-host-death family protein
MTKAIAVAEANATLSELMSRVAHGGERIVIERHGRPMVAIVTMEDLARIEGTIREEEGTDPLLRFVGAWGDVPDEEIDRIVELIYAERELNIARPPTVIVD